MNSRAVLALLWFSPVALAQAPASEEFRVELAGDGFLPTVLNGDRNVVWVKITNLTAASTVIQVRWVSFALGKAATAGYGGEYSALEYNPGRCDPHRMVAVLAHESAFFPIELPLSPKCQVAPDSSFTFAFVVGTCRARADPTLRSVTLTPLPAHDPARPCTVWDVKVRDHYKPPCEQ